MQILVAATPLVSSKSFDPTTTNRNTLLTFSEVLSGVPDSDNLQFILIKKLLHLFFFFMSTNYLKVLGYVIIRLCKKWMDINIIFKIQS